MKVIVSGSTGLIGRSLVPSLRESGHDVVRLVRRQPQGVDEIQWTPAAGTIDAKGLASADVVFHLAGAGIGDKRWTESHKREILDSRVLGTGLLASTLAGLDPKPSVMVSASAIGWYGDRGDEILVESAPQGSGFLADDRFRHRFAARIGVDQQDLADQAVTDPAESVRADIAQLAASSLLPDRVSMSGHVYDVETGLITTVVPVDAMATPVTA